MSFIEILAPGLLAALASGAAGTPAVRLRRALARARPHTPGWRGEDVEIPAMLGLGGSGNAPPALAPVTAAYDFSAEDLPSNLCRADPVHLRADPSRLILFDGQWIDLNEGEADALIEHLNAAFGGQGVSLRRGRSALRWYVALDAPTITSTPSPRALRGQPVESCLEEMRSAGALSGLLTEMQMVLYEAPVNRAREAAGKLPVNSVWFWGLGPKPSCAEPRVAAMVSDDELALACASACAVPGFPVAGGIVRAATAVAGPLGVTSALADGPDSLPAFERDVMNPALEALHRRRVDRLRVLTRSAMFEFTRLSRWMVWRSPARLARFERGGTASP